MPPSDELEAARQTYAEAIQEANNLALYLAHHDGDDELIHFLKNMEEFYNNNPGWVLDVVRHNDSAMTIYDRFKDARRKLDLIGDTD